ncbi:DUF6678 family protein [Alkaliphilus peptidifermentans]|uniref:Uncharacterized protein n=1 Tax=Alkaliphilus peptidifermentans DSM 18978 TaxID=1120976 RepID=A0A1G5LFT8_9FIRM|nr:DUF6678 family protein [Alkaliphilus peptidifermentans]SCZ11656.1 hypothetical protein SAMN03080606_04377 [Alkaliphilus peptidifermentans DSM 18978]
MLLKEKVLRIVMEKNMFSVMNNTKWRELKQGISELPFPPSFVIKAIYEEETLYHQFDKDVGYHGDWGLYLDGYLGGDMYAIPFYAVEWIKVRPRYSERQGRLIPDKIIDETEEFTAILKKYNISYEEDNGCFIIYGYRSI